MAFKGKTVTGTPIRKAVYPNGNQGFNSRAGSLGGDTVPGPIKGAPLSTKKEQMVTKKTVLPNGGNPYNDIQQNAPGVLGPDVAYQNAGGYLDSPVPGSAQHPDLREMNKAAESAGAQARIGDTPNGMLWR